MFEVKIYFDRKILKRLSHDLNSILLYGQNRYKIDSETHDVKYGELKLVFFSPLQRR